MELTYFMHKSLRHIKIPGRKGGTVIDEECLLKH
jgi:hypothetical protein